MMRLNNSISKSLSLTVILVKAAGAVNYPVGITNCNVSSWIKKAPQKAVTLNQGTTEVMLALNLSDHMAGTAYLDDEIWPLYQDEYDKIPVLAEQYPDIDTLMSVEPDFLYGSYSSAFSSNSINYTKMLEKECELVLPHPRKDEFRAFCRPELHVEGIHTYLQSHFCEIEEIRPDDPSVEGDLFAEIWDIASIFDVRDRAQALIDDIDYHFQQALAISSGSDDTDKIKVLWLDSWDDETPYVGSCCGSVQMILEHAGAKNIFEDLGLEDRLSWTSAPWEDVVAADPDLIVVVDASWDIAAEKVHNLCSHNVTRQLRAVQNRAYVVVPFSGSTLGVRIGSLAYNLAEAMAAVARGEALSSVNFSPIELDSVGVAEGGEQAITSSGVKVYTRLPVWNGTDLEATCAAGAHGLVIEDPAAQRQTSNVDDSSSSLSTGWIALITILAVSVSAALYFVYYLIDKEKKGTPVFKAIEGGAENL